jgi:hypothetical protein
MKHEGLLLIVQGRRRHKKGNSEDIGQQDFTAIAARPHKTKDFGGFHKIGQEICSACVKQDLFINQNVCMYTNNMDIGMCFHFP